MVLRCDQGASVADIFDEMNDELRAERARAMAFRYGGLALAALAVVLLGFGGYSAWQWNQQRQSAAAAVPFIAAMTTADALPTSGPAPARKQAAEAFAQVAATAPGGYQTLARLREAGLQADAGQLDAASRLWDQVAGDTSVDPLLRNLADLLWVQHQIDAGDPVAITARVQALDAADNPWRPLAEEARAMLALRQGDKPATLRILHSLADDQTVAATVRTRATGLLTILGEPEQQG